MPFDPPDIDADVDAVTDRILDGLADRIPGWVAVPGAPEVALAEELGREVAVLNQATVDVLELAAAGIGESVFGFPADQGAPATIAATVTVAGPGVVIPAGFTVTGLTADDDEVTFTLGVDVGVPAGTTATVVLTASEAGRVGNGVPSGPLTVVTVTTSVVSVTATTASTGGVDPEPIDTYLDRLTDYLATLRPGGVRGDDLAALARTVPGVHRALGVDLYDPGAPAVPAERTATVFCVDTTGHPVSAGVKTQVQDVLAAAREVNFLIHVADPTYTPVAIAYTAVAEAGANPVTVKAEVDTALARWLTTWGATTTDPQAWTDTPAVRHLDAARVAGSAPGVAYLSALTINGTAADLALPGPAALPAPLDAGAPSTITGTVDT